MIWRSRLVGTANAFLIERTQFRGKQALSLLMLAPLVIPGVILGISILAFASRIANLAADLWGLELEFLRPGLPLVVLGQFSYIVSIATLTITARLKRFDLTLEDADYNLGASRAAVFATITLPYLQPALIGAAAISFLMSFENFNTTRMLVGSDAPLTVMMYGAHARRCNAGAECGQSVLDGGLGLAGPHAAARFKVHRFQPVTLKLGGESRLVKNSLQIE